MISNLHLASNNGRSHTPDPMIDPEGYHQFLDLQRNKITQECIDQMKMVYDRTVNFSQNLDSAKGLALLGDPGIGKTVQVENALRDSKASVEYKKASTMSAIGFYYALFYNRQPHRILVLDDFDLIHHTQAVHIMSMLKVATENTYKPRTVIWDKQPTPYIIENNIPNQFEYWGNIIWITNESPESIMKKPKLRQHMGALVGPDGRFQPIVLNWTKEQKYLWTIHLIKNEGILGANCMKKKGGYTQDIQDMVVEFLTKEYTNLVSISPRGACNIADDILNFPDSWRAKTLSLNVFAWQGDKK
jgi:hypothetical protein